MSSRESTEHIEVSEIERLARFRHETEAAIDLQNYDARKERLSAIDQNVKAWLQDRELSIDIRLYLAELAWHLEQPDDSIQQLREILLTHPKEPRAYALLGRYLLFAGITDQALNFLDRAIELAPGQSELRRLRDRALRQKRKSYTRLDGSSIEGSHHFQQQAAVTHQLDAGHLQEAIATLKQGQSVRHHLSQVLGLHAQVHDEINERQGSPILTARQQGPKDLILTGLIVFGFMLILGGLFQWRVQDTKGFIPTRIGSIAWFNNQTQKLLTQESTEQDNRILIHELAEHALHAPRLDDLRYYTLLAQTLGISIPSSEIPSHFIDTIRKRIQPMEPQPTADAHVTVNDKAMYFLALGALSYRSGDYGSALNAWGKMHSLGFSKGLSQTLLAHAYLSLGHDQPAIETAILGLKSGDLDGPTAALLSRIIYSRLEESVRTIIEELLTEKMAQTAYDLEAYPHLAAISLSLPQFRIPIRNQILQHANTIQKDHPNLWGGLMEWLLFAGFIEDFDQLLAKQQEEKAAFQPEASLVRAMVRRAAIAAGEDFGRSTPLQNQSFDIFREDKLLHKSINIAPKGDTYPEWLIDLDSNQANTAPHMTLLSQRARLGVLLNRLKPSLIPQAKEALEQYPNKKDSLYALVLAHVADTENRPEIAKDMLKRLVELEPVSADYLLQSYELMLSLGLGNELSTWLNRHAAAGSYFPKIQQQLSGK